MTNLGPAPHKKIDTRRTKIVLMMICLILGLTSSIKVHAEGAACRSLFSQEYSLLQWDGQVSLKKNFESLKHIDDLSYSYTSKQDAALYTQLAEAFQNRLNSAEKEELAAYTEMSGSYHEKLNRDLSRKTPKISKKTAVFLNIFKNGVILPEGLILFRGIGPGANVQFGSKGKKSSWSRLTSTSMDPETARYFANDGPSTMMVIEVAEAIPAMMSNNPKEMEFILPPNTRFEVLSKKHFRSEEVSVVWVRAYAP